MMKVAGVPRNPLASAMLGIGGVLALWTGVTQSLLLGVAVGGSLVSTHAVFRTPNLKAKLSNYQSTDYSRP